MQMDFPLFRMDLEEVFARSTSAVPDPCVWSRQNFEICYLQTRVCSWSLTDRPVKEHAVGYFYWDSMCDLRTSLGAPSDNFRCHF